MWISDSWCDTCGNVDGVTLCNCGRHICACCLDNQLCRCGDDDWDDDDYDYYEEPSDE